MKIRTFAILFSLNGSLFAQGTMQSVFPPGYENLAGNSADQVFSGSREFQEIFRASSLASTWRTPVQITDIAFRLNENSSSFNASYPRIEIRLSTTARAPETITTVWSENSGPDAKTVYLHDNVTLVAPGGLPVNPFELRFHLDSPFSYDPANGHLAMYIKPTASGAGGTRTIDAEGLPGGASASAWATTSNFVVPAPYSLITEFTWVNIPEPGSVWLVASGLFAIFMSIRKGRS
jgi:hypothetical protein